MATSLIIDFHVHTFQSPLELLSKSSLPHYFEEMRGIRRKARSWLKPLTHTLHSMQTLLRYLPEIARDNLDQICGLAPFPGLLIESTPADLVEAMEEAQVDLTVVIAQPPYSSNEFILKISADEPRFIPVVNIPKGTLKPGAVLKKYVSQGAKALKIHPAFDGEGPDSLRYRSLMRVASDLRIPVILHTGCLHSRLLYKDASQAHPELFKKWFKNYPDLNFILAHMNMHDPNTAIDVSEEFKNVYVETSWQPAEVIGEAVRRLGAEKILFGTDWPFLGSNLAVGRKRVEECISMGMLNQNEAQLILGENAVKLLGIRQNAR